MDTLITADEIAGALPVALDPAQMAKVDTLIGLAEEEIELAFARRGRDFRSELVTVPWLELAARRAVREMVGAAVVIGPNVGVKRASSTTGPQSDSVEWHDPKAVSFGGVSLTDDLLALLGLSVGGPRGRFPRPPRWPEEGVRRVASRWW